jgi:transposase InsO family protein
MCIALNLNRSSYYKWKKRKPSKSELLNRQITEYVKDFYEESNGVLGYRQMCININREKIDELPHRINIKRVRRIMQILDLYDRRIIEYKIGDSNNNELVFTTFDEATSLYPNAKPIFHSDRGFQYTNKVFHQKLVDAGMIQSMSRVGRCLDNAPMEGWWGILKSEMYYLKKFTSR